MTCLLFAHFFPVIPACSKSKRCTCWVSTIANYLLAPFTGYINPTTDQMEALQSNPEKLEQRRLPAHLLTLITRLLPTLDSLIIHSKAERALLLPAFFKFYETCDPASTARLACLSFISKTVFDASKKIWTEEDVTKVLNTLPKLLWQLKSNNLVTSELVLTFLLQSAQGSRVVG